MKIAIKNPAPIGNNLTKWGDYHFGNSLVAALEARGVTAVQDFWPNWEQDHGEDAVVVLRGKRSFVPTGRRRKTLLWVISHPATVSESEMAAFDLVLVGSETHHRMVSGSSRIYAKVARQCTDIQHSPDLPRADDIDRRRGINFVANSRGVRREMVTWSLAAGVPISIVGRHWGPLGAKHLVARDYVDNADLGEFYRTTRLSLNDHWIDMRFFGYINNRIFDCLAAGSPILSDHFPELQDVCGDKILYADDPQSFWKSVSDYYLRYPEIHGRVHELWRTIGRDYTFDARAAQMIDWIEQSPARHHSSSPDSSSSTTLVRAHDAAVQAAVQTCLSAGGERALQVLHLFPEPDLTASLFADDRLNYLSGGFGAGPWHVAFTQELSEVVDRSFDLVVVGSDSSLRDPAELQSIIKAVGMKVRGGGVCMIPESIVRDVADFGASFRAGPTYGQFRLVMAPLVAHSV